MEKYIMQDAVQGFSGRNGGSKLGYKEIIYA